MKFTDLLLKNQELEQFIQSYNSNEFPISLIGPSDLYKSVILKLLTEKSGKDLICVLPDDSSCVNLYNDLINLGVSAFYYPSRDISFDEDRTVSREYEHLRIAALNFAFKKENGVIVTSAYAMSQRTIPKQVFSKAKMKISDYYQLFE